MTSQPCTTVGSSESLRAESLPSLEFGIMRRTCSALFLLSACKLMLATQLLAQDVTTTGSNLMLDIQPFAWDTGFSGELTEAQQAAGSAGYIVDKFVEMC